MRKALQGGRLREVITFQRARRVSDGMGGASVVWANLTSGARARAMVTTRAGNERVEAGAVAAQATYTFLIRARHDLLESDRILWRGAIYNIRSIRPRPNPLYIDIDAERGVAT